MAEQNNNENAVETQDQTEAASGIIINASQMQSIDISERFTHSKTASGWRVQLEASARVTINFMTSMRKFEVTLMQGDSIERDGDDLIVLRNKPADQYRSQRGVSRSPLARSGSEPSALIPDPPEESTV